MSDQVAPGPLHARDRGEPSIHTLLDARFPGLVKLVPRTRVATAGLGAVTVVLS